MTAGLRLVTEDDAVQCMLCGQLAEQYADLCNRCAGVFSGLADRIARGAVADLTGDPDATVIPGQLTLPADDREGPLTVPELADVSAALDTDEWAGITLRTLERAWVFHSDQFSLPELRAMRAAAGRLS